jgi:hypothetical protein
MQQEYKINPNLMNLKLSELQKLGVDCIADIDHYDILVSMRHMYLEVAKDLILGAHDKNDFDTNMGLVNCELAEKLQELIDFAEH